jgi:hypothetical protein
MLKVEPGAVLIQTGTRLPQSFQLKTAKYSEGWNLVENLNGSTLDGKLRGNNWNFIHVSGKLEASARGSWNMLTVRKATLKLLAKAKRTQLNCLEITEISKKRFLGMCYIEITGHSRHAQESFQLETLSQRRVHLDQSSKVAG